LQDVPSHDAPSPEPDPTPTLMRILDASTGRSPPR
jgi:hypothetical protein